MRGRRLVLAAIWTLVLSSCAVPPSSPPPSPSASPHLPGIRGARSDGATYYIQITDHTGWLLSADASPKDRPASADFSPNWRVDNLTNDTRILFVSWWGGQCDIGQSIDLTEEGGRLAIDLNTGYPAPPEGEACPGVGLGYRVRLAFNRDVPAASVLLTPRGVDSPAG